MPFAETPCLTSTTFTDQNVRLRIVPVIDALDVRSAASFWHFTGIVRFSAASDRHRLPPLFIVDQQMTAPRCGRRTPRAKSRRTFLRRSTVANRSPDDSPTNHRRAPPEREGKAAGFVVRSHLLLCLRNRADVVSIPQSGGARNAAAESGR
jgi:hypothetical protein